jgi:ATP-dependent helicase/nuclease subunit B
LCIYDFKTRADFRLDAVWHGLSLQLPLYLEAVRHNAHALLGRDAGVCGALLHATVASLDAKDGPAGADEGIRARFKPRGLLSTTGLARFEPEILGGGASACFRGSIKKDGALGNRKISDVLTDGELDLLLGTVRVRVAALLDGIARGRVAAVPVLFRRETACNLCSFATVCRFERYGEGERYARFPALNNLEVLGALGVAVAAEDGDV